MNKYSMILLRAYPWHMPLRALGIEISDPSSLAYVKIYTNTY